MTIRIGINGFGRIGRLVARALAEYNIDDVQLVAINSPGDISTSAHLLRYDSVHGRFKTEVIEGDNFIDYGRGKIRMTQTNIQIRRISRLKRSRPQKRCLPW